MEISRYRFSLGARHKRISAYFKLGSPYLGAKAAYWPDQGLAFDVAVHAWHAKRDTFLF